MAKTIPTDFFKTSLPVALVAGGAGFVGSCLCEKLISKNVKIVCVDIWQKERQKNIDHLLKSDKFYFLEHDISRGLPKNITKINYIVGLGGMETCATGEELSIEALERISVGARNLLQIAQDKKARFLLVSAIDADRLKKGAEAKGFAEAITREYGQKRGVDVRIARVGDVYGPRMTLSQDTALSSIIKNAIYNQPRVISSKEDIYTFPVFIDDVVEGLEKSLFTAGTGFSTITLTGPKTQALFVAKTAMFVREGKGFGGAGPGENANSLPTLGNPFFWEPKTTLEKGIGKTLKWFEKERREFPQNPESAFWPNADRQDKAKDFAKPKARPKRRISFWSFLFFGGLAFWFFLLPFLEAGAGALELYLAKRAFLSGRPKDALVWSARAGPWFSLAEEGFSRWSALPFLVQGSNKLSKNAGSLAQVAGLAETASAAFIKAENFFAGVLGEEPFSPGSLAQELSVDLANLEGQLAFIEADIKEESFAVPPLPFVDIYPDRGPGLTRVRQAVGALARILPEAGGLLGENGAKRYLILFQNNAELRPTGGFIGSFALATFERGRLVDLDVQDVYSADGQLKGHVEPPPSIKEHLGEANWFLRDSNWSPHFPTSAQRAVWFIDKELGQTVDGVAALDLDMVKQFLLETGEIALADSDQTVTADNLYEKAQTAAETDFFPGSRAKRNFLTALSRALLSRITENPRKNLAALAKTALSSFEERHLAVWTADSKVNSVLRQADWDGSVKNIFCGQTQSGCIPDYLQIIEANLGVNKANYFLDRTYSMDVAIGARKISHTLTIFYKNNSQSGVWPGGDYKNYIRLFTSQGASFVLASLKNPSGGRQDALDVDKGEEAGKFVFGTLLFVPAGESRQFSITWETPIREFGNKGEFLFLWQKQAGTQNDPVWLNVSLPEGHDITSIPLPSLTRGSTVGYNTNLAKDLFIDLLWQQGN